MDRDVVAIRLFDDRCQRIGAFRTGDLNTILRPIRKTLGAARQSMQVARGQTHLFKKASCCLHHFLSPSLGIALVWSNGLTSMPVLGEQVKEDALLRMLRNEGFVEFHSQAYSLWQCEVSIYHLGVAWCSGL